MKTTARMLKPAKLLGTRLALHEGEKVIVTPANNLPQGGWFAAPVSGDWGDDSILVQAEDFEITPR